MLEPSFHPKKSLSSISFTFYLLSFCSCMWLLHFATAYLSQNAQIFANLALSISLSFFYCIFLRLDRPHLNVYQGISLIMLTTICTPIVLQTDPFRYVWDGMHSKMGINPYIYSPIESPLGEKLQLSWEKNINHPHLPTIYPPVAQIFFHIANYLNPWQIASNLNPWRLMFGWKLTVALASGMFIYSMQSKRWDLIILHPLFLISVVGNAHLDGLLIAFVGCMLSMHLFFRYTVIKSMLLGLAILCKWLPILYLPAYLISVSRRRKLLIAWGSLSIIITFCVALIYFYASTAGPRFIYSLKIYAQHWIFFPYVHAVFSGIFKFFGYSENIHLGKLACLVVGAILAGLLSLWYWQRAISFRLYTLLISICALALSPTLHPWYLLILLPLGVPYFKCFLTPWVWPMLGLLSQSYYLNNEEFLMVRWLVYGIVSICLGIDVKKILKRLQNKPYRQ